MINASIPMHSAPIVDKGIALHNRPGQCPLMAVSWKLLRGARLMLGLSQEELAKASGVGRASIDRLERGLARTIRVTDAVQRALEARGVKFIAASKDSAGGVLLPPDPAESAKAEVQDRA
ncbi:helix-turn-helix domain-containing protein [Microvirga sp. M2]|uniref:helix-turn-helix domain-containing protein n=1 Tax=Microvirga sp. M2 TaxID=3073270 RepID=UPI0039C0A9DE